VKTARSQASQIASSVRTLGLTAIAMAFFGANSLLTRAALRTGGIDAATFTAIRIVAGAAILAPLCRLRPDGAGPARGRGSLPASLALFVYALAFSFAYLSLGAGTGALTLFAAVQMTMIGVGIASGHRLRLAEWAGLALAFSGLAYLVSPGLTAPSPIGILLMTVAGAAWGYYSLAARGIRSPLSATGGNFARAVPMAALALVVCWGIGLLHASWSGIALAAACGAVTSGPGYAIWYAVVKKLRMTQAAIVQLTVPALTAIAGVILLGERLTWRMALASATILGGVALALLGKTGARSGVGASLDP